MHRITRLLRNEQAATAVEYAVVLALILIAVVGVIGVVGAESGGLWSSNVGQLEAAGFFE